MKYVIERRKSKSSRGGIFSHTDPSEADWTKLVMIARLDHKLRIKVRAGLNSVKVLTVPAEVVSFGIRLTLPPLDESEVKTVGLELEPGTFLTAQLDHPVHLFAGTRNAITLHTPTADLNGVYPSIVRA